ncbi:methyltransferase domain-containing protein [Arthrobacter sp. R-11]|uniref:methyltransferase domain-containing protein n=1 Tax=Arthrobacter sp. R-11 TaxID=3404053 RepID=UPI003CEF4059
MADNGAEVSGIDLVPDFIAHARARFPSVPFGVGSLRSLGVGDGHLAGVLAWYSLIHFAPEDLAPVLREFARAIAPGGGLLLGFFESEELRRFPHAVTDAYSWPVERVGALLEASGFSVVESHSRTDPGHRPHAAIVARRLGRQGGTAR